MNRKGYIGVPTKLKKTYTITNMVGKIGNFESADMSNSGEGYVYCNATHVKYGQRAMLLTGSVERIETTYILRQLNVGYVQPTLTPSHKYYARVEVYQETKAGTVDIYWPINEPSFFSGLSGPAGQWNMLSAVNTRDKFPAGNYQMRIDYNNQANSASMWFDGLMLVDLTATFGAGNEPDKAWCDTNIPFTTSSTTVKWWDTEIQSRARKITDVYIGVNDVAHKVGRIYVGDENGKAKLCYPSEGEVWILNDKISIGLPNTSYTGGLFTMGGGGHIYEEITIQVKDSDKMPDSPTSPSYFWHELVFNAKIPLNSSNFGYIIISQEIASNGSAVLLTPPLWKRTLSFLPDSPPSGTMLTWLQANATKY